MDLVYTPGQGKSRVIPLIGILISFWCLSIGQAESRTGTAKYAISEIRNLPERCICIADFNTAYISNFNLKTIIGRTKRDNPACCGKKFGPAKNQINIMAKLSPPPTSSGFDTGAIPPPGTYLATIIKMEDKLGVVRSKFDNPQEYETVDLTNWLLGFEAPDKQKYNVQTFDIKISSFPECKLMKILTPILGHSPEPGYDYLDLLGSGVMITTANQQSRNGKTTYPKICSWAPVIEQLRDQVLPLSAFEEDTDSEQSAASAQSKAPSPDQPETGESEAPKKPYNPNVDGDDAVPF